MAKKGTLHNFFSNPPKTSKALDNTVQNTSSGSKRCREDLKQSDADLLDQLTNPATPAPGPRRKKLRTLLGDGEDKQTASYRCNKAAMLHDLHAKTAACKWPSGSRHHGSACAGRSRADLPGWKPTMSEMQLASSLLIQ